MPDQLTASAHCHGCDDFAPEGDPAKVDKAAEKHTAPGHATGVIVRPVKP